MKNIKTFEAFFDAKKTTDFFAIIKINSEWEKVIKEAITKVPKEAIPTVICNFSQFGKVLNRKDIFTPQTKMNYGVTMSSSEINIPKEYLTPEIIDVMKSTGFYNERILEISDTFRLHDFMLNSSIQVVGFNTAVYKKISDIAERKEKIDNLYFEKNNEYYFFNKTGTLTIYHELGHVYNNRKRISSRIEWVSLSKKWYSECKKALLKNESEAFSEAFADYFSNNGDRLPNYIKDYLTSLF